MALIICPDCKTKISETAGHCPQCGCQLTPEIIAESKRKDHNAQRTFGIGLGTFIFVVGFAAFSGVFSSPESPSSAESSAPSSAASTAPNPPAPAPAPSAPEPAPEPAEPTDETLPEIPLPDGILAQWSSVEEQPRVLIANSFIRAFEAVSPPDHHLSKRERIFRAIILDRCMIKLAEKPASMDMELNVAASICYVTSGLDRAKK